MIQEKPFTVTCNDGVPLRGLLLIPDQPKAVIQFNGGTAAKKEFYLPFLHFLVQHGYICCLWDYRGSGDSAPETLTTCEYTFLDYGVKDMPAIKEYLRMTYPELPFFVFAHSVGGQQLGFVPHLDDVQGVVGFAVSTGYLADMPWWYRLLSFYFFYIFSPLSIFFTGYVKAKPFGYMENLPRDVVRQWRDWCSKKNYFFDPKFYGKSVPKGNFKSYQFPIHIFWATDDPISNKNSVPAFWQNVASSAGINFTKIIPQSIGAKSIGHFGFFKKRFADSLWPKALTQLDQMLSKSKQKSH